MTGRRPLPLPGTTPATASPIDGTADATRAPAREGDNRVGPGERDMLRSAVQRIRAQRAIISELNI